MNTFLMVSVVEIIDGLIRTLLQPHRSITELSFAERLDPAGNQADNRVETDLRSHLQGDRLLFTKLIGKSSWGMEHEQKSQM